MNIARILSFSAFFAVSAGSAMAQTAGVAGHWLYNQDGAAIGSVRSLSADGQTATLMIGSYFQPGSHEAHVPAGALVLRDGKLVLERSTMQALNVPVR